MKRGLFHLLLAALVLGLAGLAWADWLPLIHNLPVRDNPNDPGNPFLPKSQGVSAAPSPSPTAPPTPCATSNYGGVGAGVGSWVDLPPSWGAQYIQATLTAGTVSPDVCSSNGSLCAMAAVPGGAAQSVGFNLNYSPAANLAGEQFTAQVYFTAGMSTASANGGGALFVENSSYQYYAGSFVNAPPGGGWVTLTLNLDAAYSNGNYGSAPVPVPLSGDITMFGFNFYSPPSVPAGDYTICVGSLVESSAPSPTPTPNETATQSPTITETFTISPTFTASPNFTATGTPSPTDTPTPLPTYTPGGACGNPADNSTVAGFETGIGTWASLPVSAGYIYATVTAGTMSPFVCNGSGSLCGTADYQTASGDEQAAYGYDPATAYNFSSDVSLTAMVYFPPGFYSASADPSAQLYIKTGSGYAYYSGSAVNVPDGGGWVQVGLVFGAAFSGGTGSPVAVANADDVLELGVSIYDPSNGPSGGFMVCVDSINVDP